MSIRFVFSGQAAVVTASMLSTIGLLLGSVWCGLQAFIASRMAGRPSLRDRAPAELVASIYLLPLATAMTGLAVTLPSVGLDVMRDLGSELTGTAGLLALEMALVVTLFTVLLPFVALRTVVDEREGRSAALFDVDASEVGFRAALTERWDELVRSKRRWLRDLRGVWLGDEDDPPVGSWPARRGPTPSRGIVWLDRVPLVAIPLAVCGGLVAVVAVWQPVGIWDSEVALTLFAVGYGTVQAALTVLIVWLYCYWKLAREQGQAEVLRLAKSQRPAPVVSPGRATRLTLSERWALIRQAITR